MKIHENCATTKLLSHLSPTSNADDFPLFLRIHIEIIQMNVSQCHSELLTKPFESLCYKFRELCIYAARWYKYMLHTTEALSPFPPCVLVPLSIFSLAAKSMLVKNTFSKLNFLIRKPALDEIVYLLVILIFCVWLRWQRSKKWEKIVSKSIGKQ